MHTLFLVATTALLGTVVQDPGNTGVPWAPRRSWEICAPANGTVLTGVVVSINVSVVKPFREEGHLRVTQRNGSVREVANYSLGAPRSITVPIDNGGSPMSDGEYVIELFADSNPGVVLETITVTVVESDAPEKLPTVDCPIDGTRIVTYDGQISLAGRTGSRAWVALFKNGEFHSMFEAVAQRPNQLLWRHVVTLPLESATYTAYAYPGDPTKRNIAPTDSTTFDVVVPIDVEASRQPDFQLEKNTSPIIPIPDWRTLGR